MNNEQPKEPKIRAGIHPQVWTLSVTVDNYCKEWFDAAKVHVRYEGTDHEFISFILKTGLQSLLPKFPYHDDDADTKPKEN
jgi:hypothetical protein